LLNEAISSKVEVSSPEVGANVGDLFSNDLQTKVMKDIPSSSQYMIMKEEACKI
jgi:hypothetical protein